jgi:nitroreductase
VTDGIIEKEVHPREAAMIDILRTRRSIRKYQTEQINMESIKLIEEALLRSPSSRGINPWTFILVDEPELLQKLSESKQHGSQFLKNAALGIVVCGDETESDVWIEDCSIAAILAQLTAHSLGLGSCWIQIRNRLHTSGQSAEDYIRDLLGIPEGVKVLSIISIGYPAETKQPVPSERLDHGKIMRNIYINK